MRANARAPSDDGESWDLAGLRRLVFAIIDERDRRYEQRFQAQEAALRNFDADMSRRFDKVNELRGVVEDQARHLMPRAESLLLHAATATRLEELSKRVLTREGEQAGGKDQRGDSRAMWVVWIAVAAVVFQGVALFLTR